MTDLFNHTNEPAADKAEATNELRPHQPRRPRMAGATGAGGPMSKRYRLNVDAYHRCLGPVSPGGGPVWHDEKLPAGTIGELVYAPRPGRKATLKVGEQYVYVPVWSDWQSLSSLAASEREKRRRRRLTQSRGARSRYVRKVWPAAKPKGRNRS